MAKIAGIDIGGTKISGAIIENGTIQGDIIVEKTPFSTKDIIQTAFNIIEKLKMNDIFGHNIICCGLDKSPVDVIAENECEVLFLPFEKVVTPCSKLCSYHLQLIKNVMKMISKRNSLLNDKIDIIGQKTTRDKILALLETYRNGQKVFSIPYSREEMAKFLCVDRSAMSRELCRMRDEGILKFSKNHFEIL